MATTVTNNPFDTQQPSNSGGVIGGAIQSGSPTNAAQYTPQQRDVNRATETASGQVDSLLAKDSPLMQRARTLAMQNMNARGLVNSSMAQGAGVAAMIDRITPIAQQDAETYSNRALANMQAVNEGGMFNVGEQNRFGLQRGQQDFQTSERFGSQAFQSSEANLTRNFQQAQSELDRALQVSLADKSIEANTALERARQNFQSAENALQRQQETSLQQSQQIFQSTQNQLDRQQQTDLNRVAQDFQASQSELDRAQQIMLADKNISAQQALEQVRQEFESEQRGLDRGQARDLAQAARDLQSSEAELDRAQQIMLADRNISAQQALEQGRQEFESEERGLDREQARDLAQAARDLQSSEADLDRAQQIMLADKNISAQQALETARQEFESGERVLDRHQQLGLQQAQQQFEATQSQLDRDQQESMVRLQNELSQANVSGVFAANITASTSSAINAILADGSLDPEPKREAIQNIIDNANATLQWGSTFYNTTLPSIGSPGSTPPTIDPGGTVQPGGLPSTMTPGQTNDSLWEQVLRENYDAHVARYGIDWNTSRTTDAERANALASMQAEYERRKQGLVNSTIATAPPPPRPPPPPPTSFAGIGSLAPVSSSLSTDEIAQAYRNTVGQGTLTEAQFLDLIRLQYGVTDMQVLQANNQLPTGQPPAAPAPPPPPPPPPPPSPPPPPRPFPPLPPNWYQYDERAKLNWFNENNVTPEQLAAAGVSQAEIDYIQAQRYL